MFPVIFPVIFPSLILMIITSVASFQATEELGYQRDRARHHEVGAPIIRHRHPLGSGAGSEI